MSAPSNCITYLTIDFMNVPIKAECKAIYVHLLLKQELVVVPREARDAWRWRRFLPKYCGIGRRAEVELLRVAHKLRIDA